jgi:hypothetical protein
MHASRREKGQLLNEFCVITGYTRKHALVLLSHPPGEQRVTKRRGRPTRYGPAEVALLRVCVAATDGICSKRLAPFLPELLQRLRYWHALHDVSRETIARVAQMSPATIDRALAASRDGLPKRGLSTTRPGTLLKHQSRSRRSPTGSRPSPASSKWTSWHIVDEPELDHSSTPRRWWMWPPAG